MHRINKTHHHISIDLARYKKINCIRFYFSELHEKKRGITVVYKRKLTNVFHRHIENLTLSRISVNLCKENTQGFVTLRGEIFNFLPKSTHFFFACLMVSHAEQRLFPPYVVIMDRFHLFDSNIRTMVLNNAIPNYITSIRHMTFRFLNQSIICVH